MSFAALCFAVLCCAVLCCAVLCCAVLCCAVLCCAAFGFCLHVRRHMLPQTICGTVLGRLKSKLPGASHLSMRLHGVALQQHWYEKRKHKPCYGIERTLVTRRSTIQATNCAQNFTYLTLGADSCSIVVISIITSS